MLPKLKVLFLCTRNSCRSQMAEAWARVLHGERLEAYSAGSEPASIDPRAADVMREAGMDLSSQRSKHVRELVGIDLDHVITLCDQAREACPVFPPSVRIVHIGFDDPPRLEANAPSEDGLAHYRRVRDEIRAFVTTLPDTLATASVEEASRT